MTRSRKKNPYRESRRFDPTCRNHGSCPYCAEGRLRAYRAADFDEKEQLVELLGEAVSDAEQHVYGKVWKRLGVSPGDVEDLDEEARQNHLPKS